MMVNEAILSAEDDGNWEIIEGWRDQLRMIATSTWRLYRRHRW